MYIGDKTVSPRVYEDRGERWEYAVALTPTQEFVTRGGFPPLQSWGLGTPVQNEPRVIADCFQDHR